MAEEVPLAQAASPRGRGTPACTACPTLSMKTKLWSFRLYCFSKMTSFSALQLGLRFSFLGVTCEEGAEFYSTHALTG